MSFSLIEVWNQSSIIGKGVFVLLVLMSVYSLGLVAERLLRFAAARRESERFVDGLRELLGEGSLEPAIALSERHPKSPVAKVVAAAVRGFVEASKRISGAAAPVAVDLVEALDRNLERVRDREVAGLKRGLSGLATVGSTAPFVGLFGTVVGIIRAFTSMSTTGSGGLGAVSADIAEALVATGLGLFVAIPAVALYNHLSGRVDELVVDINDVSGELVAHVLSTGGIPAAAPAPLGAERG
jgi:biopolymer transport protein ExbB